MTVKLGKLNSKTIDVSAALHLDAARRRVAQRCRDGGIARLPALKAPFPLNGTGFHLFSYTDINNIKLFRYNVPIKAQ